MAGKLWRGLIAAGFALALAACSGINLPTDLYAATDEVFPLPERFVLMRDDDSGAGFYVRTAEGYREVVKESSTGAYSFSSMVIRFFPTSLGSGQYALTMTQSGVDGVQYLPAILSGTHLKVLTFDTEEITSHIVAAGIAEAAAIDTIAELEAVLERLIADEANASPIFAAEWFNTDEKAALLAALSKMGADVFAEAPNYLRILASPPQS